MYNRLPYVFVLFFLAIVIAIQAEPVLYRMTPAIVEDTRKRFDDYVVSVKAQSDLRSNALPILRLHPANSRVYGTVMVFPGFGKLPSDMNKTAYMLYQKQFNVVQLCGDGYDRTDVHWPATSFSKPSGNSVRSVIYKAVSNSTNLKMRAVQIIRNPTAATASSATNSAIYELYKNITAIYTNTTTGNSTRACIEALNPNYGRLSTSARSKLLQMHFVSDHSRIAARAAWQYSLAASLPGPVNVVAHSYGSTAALSVAASSGAISNLVLLAPNFARVRDGFRRDHAHYVGILRALGLLSSSKSEALLAAQIAAREITSQKTINSIQMAGTRTFAVFAEDDKEVDLQFTKEIVGNLAASSYTYKAKLGFGNNITPDTRQSGYEPMMKVVSKFLKGYDVDMRDFEVKQEDFTEVTDKTLDELLAGDSIDM